MFKPLDDNEVFFFREIAKITLSVKIAEWVERHGFVSRRYRA